jgi:nucleotide-binding universal stress UspA family protein
MKPRTPLSNIKRTEEAVFETTGRPRTTEVRADDAAGGLLAAAEERSVDLLMVGSHGYSGLNRFLLGSVSAKALRHAGCSVLVVRPTGGSSGAAGTSAG